jgi:hypothetical protein
MLKVACLKSTKECVMSLKKKMFVFLFLVLAFSSLAYSETFTHCINILHARFCVLIDGATGETLGEAWIIHN